MSKRRRDGSAAAPYSGCVTDHPRRVPWTAPLELIDLPHDDSVMSVYERDLMNTSRYFDESWWTQSTMRRSYERHVVVHSGDEEVARFLVKPSGRIFEQYRGPHAGKTATQIVFLEVNTELRRRYRGIGTQAVELLSADIPGRLFANADQGPAGFWATLGWDEYEPHGDPAHSWRVFVRPD